MALLAFPQQAASLKPLLGEVLRRVFSTSGFDARVMLRGVYFTSGTQEGTPIDRMLGAIARSFGFASSVTPSQSGAGTAHRGAVTPAPGAGAGNLKPYVSGQTLRLV